MKFEKVSITPQMANDWLSFNKSNRTLRLATSRYYADQMKAGAWRCDTAETIKFDPDHNLVDGQHRLMGVQLSGMTVDMWVAYDVPPESFAVIDSGLMRSSADVFFVSGVQYARMLPTIISMVKQYEGGTMTASGGGRKKQSSQELLAIYKENPIFWDECVKNAYTWYGRFKGIPVAVWGMLGAILSRLNNDECMEFLNALSSGRNVSHDGIFKIRDRFISEMASTAKTRSEFKIGLIIKMWNSIRKGKPMLRPSFEPSKEALPKAI